MIYFSMWISSSLFLSNDIFASSLKIDIIIILLSEHVFMCDNCLSLSISFIMTIEAYISLIINISVVSFIHWQVIMMSLYQSCNSLLISDSSISLIFQSDVCSCHLREGHFLSLFKKETLQVLTVFLSTHEVWIWHFKEEFRYFVYFRILKHFLNLLLLLLSFNAFNW